MTWLQIAAFLAVSLVVCAAALEVFAFVLRRVAPLPAPWPLLLGMAAHGVLVLVFASLLFVQELFWPAQTQGEREVALVLWLVCLALAVLWFRQRHLKSLKALGYYAARDGRH